jgi:hypothetical protein
MYRIRYTVSRNRDEREIGMSGEEDSVPGLSRPELVRVLESAARLQAIVPDAVLVGGSAAALWAGHRLSFDHDHVVKDLNHRFDAVLEAIEATEGWVTNRVVPGKIVLGTLGDIEAGVRQLIRSRPLEVTEVELPSGHRVRVPTWQETLRIKAYLLVRRNQVRDYVDVAAIADREGVPAAARVLAAMDAYYADQRPPEAQGVATQVARQLAAPRPQDTRTLGQLRRYKDLDVRWTTWDNVVSVCRALAREMTR